MSSGSLSRKLASIAHTWTKDPFRPNIQLSAFLLSLSSHPRLTKRAVADAGALHDNELMKKVLYQTLQHDDQGLSCNYSIHYHRRQCDQRRDLCTMSALYRDMTKVPKGLVDHGGKSSSAFGDDSSLEVLMSHIPYS